MKLVMGRVIRFDCTDVRIDFEDDPTLTREENAALMEQAFYRSLSKFDACQDAQSNANAGSGGGGGGGGGASGAGSDMTGTNECNVCCRCRQRRVNRIV